MELTIFSNPQIVFKIDLSIIIATFALAVSIKSFIFSKKKGKTEQSVALAKEYSTLLKDITLINNIIVRHPEIQKIIKNRPSKNEQLQFTKSELESFYRDSPEDINKLENFFNGNTLDIEKTAVLLKVVGEKDINRGDSYVEAGFPDNFAIKAMFRMVTGNLLNKLEYFSMNFISGVADDDLVYQSLHQSFFKIVDVLYYRIASANINIEDKYYTNIIELYNRWIYKNKVNTAKIRANEKNSADLVRPTTKI